MKKADITKATSKHDTCAIFEVQRGDSGMKRYARLMTEEEKQALNINTNAHRFASRSTAPKVMIVYVDAINNCGKTSSAPSSYVDFVVTGFADSINKRWNGEKMKDIDTVPLARIKQCVNETHSFVDFFNAEVFAMKDAVKREKEAAKRREQLAENHKNRINDLNARVVGLGLTDTRSVSEARSYYGISNEVTISIDILTELLRIAEKARLTEMVGA